MMRLGRRQVLRAGAAACAAAMLPRALMAGDAVFAPPAATLARAFSTPGNARDLAMIDVSRQPISYDAVAEGRLAVLNLWGPWCIPCRREMPSVAALAAAMPEIAVVPLAFDWRGPVTVRRFFAELGIKNLPVLMGDGENLKAVLGLENLPTTLIVAPDGQVTHSIAAEAQWDDPATQDWLRSLL